MAAATQIWSATYTRAFDRLPERARSLIERRVDEMGMRLASFPHKRLVGRSEFKLRIGNYRVFMNSTPKRSASICITLEIAGKFTKQRIDSALLLTYETP